MKHRRTCVYQIGYHVVFCTKYRRKLLTGELDAAFKTLLAKIAVEHGYEIETVETAADHVHLFVSVPPHVAISNVVKVVKGGTAYQLYRQFPDLRQRLPKGHLWNPSYYVGTVGEMSEDVVRRYIENQKAG